LHLKKPALSMVAMLSESLATAVFISKENERLEFAFYTLSKLLLSWETSWSAAYNE